MPIDVLDAPPIYARLKNEVINPVIPRQPVLAEIKKHTPEESINIYWGDVQNAVDRSMKELSGKFKDIPPAERDLIGDLFFGPFRIPQEALSGTSDEYFKTMSAQIQHNLAHNIIYASETDATLTFKKGIYEMLLTQQNILGSEYGKALRLGAFWSGVRSEIAVIRTLLSDGYKVWLPDYAEDQEDDNTPHEVTEWDVRKGIDFVAQKGRKMVLVDAKGRAKTWNYISMQDNVWSKVESCEYYRTPYVEAIHQLPKTLQALVDRESPEEVKKTTIIIPSKQTGQVGVKAPGLETGELIRQYGMLPIQQQQAICREIL